ncbi:MULTISPECIES: hypothetical protein [Empedobacter]|uniref:hypothetical protein n=1 Tax=Empedobacter TaxID=59734 RepID=UPI0025790379|nr:MULTISPECIES: hypothetical protein [Empedobacter]MDM1040195.1 hypothetical protein [Empedobacter brevis]MDM1134127.1 hypothetical protein [Empedobacter sp. R750]
MKKSFYIKTFIRKGCNTLLVFLCSLFSLFSYAQIYTTGDAILYVSQDATLTQKLITPTKLFIASGTTVVGEVSSDIDIERTTISTIEKSKIFILEGTSVSGLEELGSTKIVYIQKTSKNVKQYAKNTPKPKKEKAQNNKVHKEENQQKKYKIYIKDGNPQQFIHFNTNYASAFSPSSNHNIKLSVSPSETIKQLFFAYHQQETTDSPSVYKNVKFLIAGRIRPPPVLASERKQALIKYNGLLRRFS